MNILIMNEASNMFSSLEIDVVKSFSGLFSVREIKDMIGVTYYDKIVLDITAIRNHHSNDTLQELASNFDMSKVILILENNDASIEPKYISMLISLGIYNFTRNHQGLMYLLQNTNSYKDVAHLHQPEVHDNIGHKVMQKQKIIGFINVTEHAGASSLIFMMLKNLSKFTKCGAIEIGKFDFKYFRHPDMLSTTIDELDSLINNKFDNYNVILLDLNNYHDCSICHEIIYLIEPTILKINKLTAESTAFMIELKGKNVVLNQSNISEKAILDFAQETGLYVYQNIRSLNDRDSSHADILDLIDKLNLVSDDNQKEEPKKGLFGIL